MNKERLGELRNIVNTYHKAEPPFDDTGWKSIICADIVIYFEGFDESLKTNASGILDFYNHAMALVKGEMKWALINGEGKFRKITKKAFDMIPFWLSPEGREPSIRGVDMQGGPDRNGRIDKSFSFHHSTRSHLRLTLPVEYMLEDPQRFIDLARQMVGRLKFATGNAGFSVNMYLDGIGNDREEGSHIYMLSRRFDGLDLGVPWDSAYYAKHGLRTINWLTFIGDDIIERINGRDAVKGSLPQGIPVTDLDHGLMIQAGPRPILGDTNRQEDLGDYYRVGRALRPFALHLPAILDPETSRMEGYGSRIGGIDNTERWHKRFFKG
jgi:Protein of unknown function (DUF3396)